MAIITDKINQLTEISAHCYLWQSQQVNGLMQLQVTGGHSNTNSDTAGGNNAKTPTSKLPQLSPSSSSSFVACNSYDCVAPYVDIILHRGWFWAKSAASGSIGGVVSDPVGRCLATWCKDDLVVFSSLPEGSLTGSSWHLHWWNLAWMPVLQIPEHQEENK